MWRAERGLLLLTVIFVMAAPACASAATVNVALNNITYTAAAGEANTAVIVNQPSGVPGTVFVGDLNTAVTVTTTGLPLCTATPPGSGLPAGFLCAGLSITGFNMNLGDGDDTGVVNGGTVPTTIDGGDGDDLLVGGPENDTFTGGANADTVAYAGVDAAAITRTAGVTATLPAFPSGAATTGNGNTTAGESDTIANDVEGLVGGNGDDTLTGNDGPNTIAGAAPPGTPSVVTTPAGNDTINGAAGDDTLVGGDTGAINGGAGGDSIVGGRSTTGTTIIHGDADDDTLVSGLGNDSIFGDGGSNTLAYASVVLGTLTVVDRGTNGVTVTLPATGQTATGGKTGGPELDTIHDDVGTLVGSNGDDVLTGSPRNDILTGVAPAGTAGVAPGPPGNDTLNGGDGVDLLLGGTGDDILNGGPSVDVMSAGPGADRVEARDGNVEAPACGDGVDTAIADPADTPASDCETVDTGATTPPPGGADTTAPVITVTPKTPVLGKGRKVKLSVACANEAAGCSGALVIKTAKKLPVKPGKKAKKRFRLGRVAFTTTSAGAVQVTAKLSKRTLRLVGRGRSLGLTVTATAADTSANKTLKTLRLKLKRR